MANWISFFWPAESKVVMGKAFKSRAWRSGIFRPKALGTVWYLIGYSMLSIGSPYC